MFKLGRPSQQALALLDPGFAIARDLKEHSSSDGWKPLEKIFRICFRLHWENSSEACFVIHQLKDNKTS